MPSTHQDLKPWIARALAAGRKPLPDARPGGIAETQSVEAEGIKKPRAARNRVPRRPWSTTEIQLLLRLKAKGKKWDDIQDRFPDRSIDGIKQTYWKYRSNLKVTPKTLGQITKFKQTKAADSNIGSKFIAINKRDVIGLAVEGAKAPIMRVAGREGAVKDEREVISGKAR